MTWLKTRKSEQFRHSCNVQPQQAGELVHAPGHQRYSQPVYSQPTTSMIHVPAHPKQPVYPYPYQQSSTVHLPQRQDTPSQRQRLGKWQSCTDLSKNVVSQTVDLANNTVSQLEQQVRDCVAGGVDFYDTMWTKLDQVITEIDEELFGGREKDLVVSYHVEDTSRPKQKKKIRHTATTYFSKVYLYSNSRLPPNLPPLKLYRPAYPLLRLAAQSSLEVYDKPAGAERQFFVDADWRHGTKAMVIKSLPIDNMDTIVFSIRGTQSFLDWAVNMRTEPTSPRNFLDDTRNFCHAGFLSVAKKMVAPIAAHLRNLLAENPSRASCSLLLCGHSAGGAVAQLLYCHMLSSVRSGLSHLRSFFKTVHCVTFGAPPVSLRPLQLPPRQTSMFFSFINEGDPVARAEKAYVLSLLDLYVSPVSGFAFGARRQERRRRYPQAWRVPQATLSNAGLIVLLRKQTAIPENTVSPGVEALVTTDSALRGVVFGDPLMHMMDLYAKRIDELAMDLAYRY